MELQKLTYDQFLKITSIGFNSVNHTFDPGGTIPVATALKFMRENKKLDAVIQPYYPNNRLKYNVSVLELDPNSELSEDLGDVNSHDQAEVKALDFMIRHLMNEE